MYDSKYSFSDYKNVRKCSDISLEPKYYKLVSFYYRLNEFRSSAPQAENTKIRKKNVFKNVTKLYNTLLAIYFKEYNNVIYEKRSG